MTKESIDKDVLDQSEPTPISASKEATSPAYIPIEVAFATPQKQVIKTLDVVPDIHIRAAIEQSKITVDFPNIDISKVKIGIFGKLVKEDYQLNPYDRIEIYRPLLADPKEVRRRLAAQGKTMGKNNGQKQ